MTKLFWNFTFVFCLLFIATFEFHYSLLPDVHLWINPIFEQLVVSIGTSVFGCDSLFNPTISSDSEGFFVHVSNLIWLSALWAFLLKLMFGKKGVNLRPYLLKLLTYYLSLQLLIYGFDKLFKAQFFLPEPNIMHSQFGDLSKDILYWSTMGLSRGYSLFLGGAEIIVALFLLFPKTRILGAVLGVGILVNVVAINFGFDISVKGYSLFLLMSSLLILSPYFLFLYSAFTLQNKIPMPKNEAKIRVVSAIKKRVIKSLVILVFLAEGLFPYIQSGNYNDDTAKRPKFHGAYEVSDNKWGIKKLFVHRHGYLIFQNEKDEMEDFQLTTDTINQNLIAWDYRKKKEIIWKYEEENSQIIALKSEEMDVFINCKVITKEVFL